MTITIIVPIKDEAPYLARCLDSIARQTRKPSAVVLIDDGSTDGSQDIARTYARKYGWRFLEFKYSQGVSAARNYGLQMTKTDYVYFMDADDELMDGAVATMLKMGECFPSLDIMQFNYGVKHEGVIYSISKVYVQEGFYELQDLPEQPPHWYMVWNKLYKSEFIAKNKLKFKPKLQYGEDEEFNLRAIMANGGIDCFEPLIYLRHFDNEKSLSHSKQLNELIEQDKALRGIQDQTDEPQCLALINRVREMNHHSRTYTTLKWRPEYEA